MVLPAGKLPYRYLIAGITNHLRQAPSLETISDCIAAIITRAEQLNLHSLAIPILRVGRALEWKMFCGRALRRCSMSVISRSHLNTCLL
ncbi:MAG: hypothetical protein HC822_15335 [Oscillochloris sp.]|nr:hypothetical protein [Oscillochloris sp.]